MGRKLLFTGLKLLERWTFGPTFRNRSISSLSTFLTSKRTLSLQDLVELLRCPRNFQQDKITQTRSSLQQCCMYHKKCRLASLFNVIEMWKPSYNNGPWNHQVNVINISIATYWLMSPDNWYCDQTHTRETNIIDSYDSHQGQSISMLNTRKKSNLLSVTIQLSHTFITHTC